MSNSPLSPYSPAMTDELSEQSADLLQGSHDCVDRIVLNAYNTLCCSPGGFRPQPQRGRPAAGSRGVQIGRGRSSIVWRQVRGTGPD